MTDRDLESLALSNVGLLGEVDEMLTLLRACIPAMNRARASCRKQALYHSDKHAASGDVYDDATSGQMYNAAAEIRQLVISIEEMAKKYA